MKNKRQKTVMSKSLSGGKKSFSLKQIKKQLSSQGSLGGDNA